MGQKEKSWSRIIRVRKERLGQYKTRRGRAWDEWEKAARSRLISTSCFTTQIIASNEDRVNFIMKTNRNRECCTEWMEWMSHRKQKETKQQPGTAGPGNIPSRCLVYLRFLCDIHSIHPVPFWFKTVLGWSHLLRNKPLGCEMCTMSFEKVMYCTVLLKRSLSRDERIGENM